MEEGQNGGSPEEAQKALAHGPFSPPKTTVLTGAALPAEHGRKTSITSYAAQVIINQHHETK
jgi:hypothetical protein